MQLKFTIHTFAQLSNTQLYECLALRYNVFVVEQNCIYPEFDKIDYTAIHVLGTVDGKLVAYTRLYVDQDNKAHIGRVVIHKDYREKNYGSAIMNYSIDYIRKNFESKTIRISAQQHLQKFYLNLNFITCSPMYLDYGIPHVDMELKLT